MQCNPVLTYRYVCMQTARTGVAWVCSIQAHNCCQCTLREAHGGARCHHQAAENLMQRVAIQGIEQEQHVLQHRQHVLAVLGMHAE